MHQTLLTAGKTFLHWQALKALCLLLVVLLLSACAADSQHQKTMTGMTMGAALGAIVGSVVGGHDGAALGALIGAAAGAAVGAKLDADDQRKHQAALALAAGQAPGGAAAWESPNKGTSGQVARIGDMFVVDGKQCMTVQETITIQGKPETVQDVRCQDGGGQWVQKAT